MAEHDCNGYMECCEACCPRRCGTEASAGCDACTDCAYPAKEQLVIDGTFRLLIEAGWTAEEHHKLRKIAGYWE